MADHIKDLHARLVAERDAIDARVKPLRERAEALRAQIAPLEVELRGIDKELKTVLTDAGYTALSQEIGKLDQLIAGQTSKMRRRLIAEPGGVVSEGQPLGGEAPPA